MRFRSTQGERILTRNSLGEQPGEHQPSDRAVGPNGHEMIDPFPLEYDERRLFSGGHADDQIEIAVRT